MEKKWMLENVRYRIDVLKGYLRSYTNGVEVGSGKKLSSGSAAYKRTTTRRDLHICYLLEDILQQLSKESIYVSEEGENGFERLVDPNERHIRLR